MTQPLVRSTISTQSRSAKFLTMKTMVRKNQKNDSQTGCLNRAVLAQGRGGLFNTSLPGANSSKLIGTVETKEDNTFKWRTFASIMPNPPPPSNAPKACLTHTTSIGEPLHSVPTVDF